MSLAGPVDDIEIRRCAIDWEVELVAVIGRRADRVDETHAWAPSPDSPSARTSATATSNAPPAASSRSGSRDRATETWGCGS